MGRRIIAPEVRDEALRLIAKGMLQKEAAEKLGVSVATVHVWISHARASGEWDAIMEKARFEAEADAARARQDAPDPPAQAIRQDAPAPPPKAKRADDGTVTRSPGDSPYFGFGWQDTSRPPPAMVPELPSPTVAIPCVLCGRLVQPHEMGAGRKLGVCPECLGLWRGVVKREREKQCKNQGGKSTE